MRISPVVICLLAATGCGIVVLQDVPVQAPQNAPSEVRREWNPAERGRQAMLKGDTEHIGLETCRRYQRVEAFDPDFYVMTLTGKVTVRNRVEEVCRLTVEAIGQCRANKHESKCPDLATAADLVTVIQGRPADPANLPGWLTAQLRADIALWIAGQFYLGEARKVTESHREGQLGFCEALTRLRMVVDKVPTDIRQQYSSALLDEAAASAHSKELQQHKEARQREVQRAARFGAPAPEVPLLTELHQRVALSLRLSPSAAQPFLSVLDEQEVFVVGRYRVGAILRGAVLNPEALRKAGMPTVVDPGALRSTAAEVRCSQDYRPAGANMLSAVQLADELEKLADQVEADLARMQASAAAQATEESRCLADPECVKERQVERVLAEACGYVQELDEVKVQMRERLSEGRKWGVINVRDQHDDLEAKQSLEEMIAEEAKKYRAITGKKFNRSVCVRRQAEMVLYDLCDTLEEARKTDRADIKRNLEEHIRDLKDEYRQVTGTGFKPGMCKKLKR